MPSLCFYFQVHQPFRLNRYRIFDIGTGAGYFDDAANREILQRVAHKCYLPMNELLLRLIDLHGSDFRVGFSISGTAIDQLERWCPEALASFQALAATGCVEFLAETDEHSLSFVYDRDEFDRQLDAHVHRIERTFGRSPTAFRNTELIFSNDLAIHLAGRGFEAILAEGADKMLGWRSPDFVYTSPGNAIPLLLKNYRLSDDIAFRFSSTAWPAHPLTTQKFTDWINGIHGNGQVVNLFMDYETFGEHQWADTGIFGFMENLPGAVLRHPDNDFMTPTEAARAYPPVGVVSAPEFISWADTERDLSAWLGNAMQLTAARALYDLREPVLATDDGDLIHDWRRLTTSDHLYYICTKWFADGDVHKYFNPFGSPYDAYITFMNVLNDVARRAGAQQSTPAVVHERPAARIPEPARAP